MMVRLIILQGQMQDRQSRSSKAELEIRRRRFVIGSASDCSMRCPSKRISPHHCQLLVQPAEVVLEDLASETGTFVNGTRVERRCVLQNGDHLRIGRLEFEVLIEDPSPVWEVGPRGDADTIHDAMADTICELLLAADERDRKRRLQDPELRHLALPSAGDPTGLQQEPASPAEHESRAGRKTTSQGTSRFPVRVHPADDSSIAAAEALRSYFTTHKVYIPLQRTARHANPSAEDPLTDPGFRQGDSGQAG